MLKIEGIWQEHTQQKIFRELLYCMSLPGEIINLNQYLEKSSALVGVLATLLDRSVTWSDEDELVNKRDRSLFQASQVSSQTAQFVVKNALHPPLSAFIPNLGELSNPEKGATLILQGESLGIGNKLLELAGAGIKETRLVCLAGFHLQWFICRQQWVENFPLGVDLILVDRSQIMALPRTTQIQLSNFSSSKSIIQD